jgi:hypothetical protein
MQVITPDLGDTGLVPDSNGGTTYRHPQHAMTDGAPTYMGGGDSAGKFNDYYPAWIDNLADDVTVEGSLLDGAGRRGRPDNRGRHPHAV